MEVNIIILMVVIAGSFLFFMAFLCCDSAYDSPSDSGNDAVQNTEKYIIGYVNTGNNITGPSINGFFQGGNGPNNVSGGIFEVGFDDI